MTATSYYYLTDEDGTHEMQCEIEFYCTEFREDWGMTYEAIIDSAIDSETGEELDLDKYHNEKWDEDCISTWIND